MKGSSNRWRLGADSNAEASSKSYSYSDPYWTMTAMLSRHLAVHTTLIHSGCTPCAATCGNGVPTGAVKNTFRIRPGSIQPGQRTVLRGGTFTSTSGGASFGQRGGKETRLSRMESRLSRRDYDRCGETQTIVIKGFRSV